MSSIASLRVESIKAWHIARLLVHHGGARLKRSRRKLPIDEYLKTIDAHKVQEIAATYYGAGVKNREGFKYVDNIEKNLKVGAAHALDLDLDIAAPKRILDLGCGAGYFLYASQLLGHDCLGLDAPFVPAYKAMTEALGIKRVTYAIQAFENLPDLGEPFDLITAFRVCFNGRGSDEKIWESAEWDFFLRDVTPRLKPGGLLQLRLIGVRGQNCYTPELLSFFLKRGAEVYRSTIRLRREDLVRAESSD